jgi:hypothetical protein
MLDQMHWNWDHEHGGQGSPLSRCVICVSAATRHAAQCHAAPRHVGLTVHGRTSGCTVSPLDRSRTLSYGVTWHGMARRPLQLLKLDHSNSTLSVACTLQGQVTFQIFACGASRNRVSVQRHAPLCLRVGAYDGWANERHAGISAAQWPSLMRPVPVAGCNRRSTGCPPARQRWCPSPRPR